MEETQWIDWHPKVGDIKPERYQIKLRDDPDDPWEEGFSPNKPVEQADWEDLLYRIPASVVTPPEDRPPWIDPQCKFRWGDRVKHTNGHIYWVIHPYDQRNPAFPVIIAESPAAAAPYTTKADAIALGIWFESSLDGSTEHDLTLFPEELPQHFDDRLLDADQPQEQPKTARVPREIWVSSYGNHLGPFHYPSLEAALEEESSSIPVHFREVLPDDLSNIQYSPGG